MKAITLFVAAMLATGTAVASEYSVPCGTVAKVTQSIAEARLRGVDAKTAKMTMHDIAGGNKEALRLIKVSIDWVYGQSTPLSGPDARQQMNALCLDARHGSKVR